MNKYLFEKEEMKQKQVGNNQQQQKIIRTLQMKKDIMDIIFKKNRINSKQNKTEEVIRKRCTDR